MNENKRGGKRLGSGRKKIDPLLKLVHEKEYFARYYQKNKHILAPRYKSEARRKRITVLEFYGGKPPKCKCCGEKEISFLSIDHVNGGGNKHRKESGVGCVIYPWLIRNNFPKGFQILCYNCNMSKGFYGKCPHDVL